MRFFYLARVNGTALSNVCSILICCRWVSYLSSSTASCTSSHDLAYDSSLLSLLHPTYVFCSGRMRNFLISPSRASIAIALLRATIHSCLPPRSFQHFHVAETTRIETSCIKISQCSRETAQTLVNHNNNIYRYRFMMQTHNNAICCATGSTQLQYCEYCHWYSFPCIHACICSFMTCHQVRSSWNGHHK